MFSRPHLIEFWNFVNLYTKNVYLLYDNRRILAKKSEKTYTSHRSDLQKLRDEFGPGPGPAWPGPGLSKAILGVWPTMGLGRIILAQARPSLWI